MHDLQERCQCNSWWCVSVWVTLMQLLMPLSLIMDDGPLQLNNRLLLGPLHLAAVGSDNLVPGYQSWYHIDHSGAPSLPEAWYFYFYFWMVFNSLLQTYGLVLELDIKFIWIHRSHSNISNTLGSAKPSGSSGRVSCTASYTCWRSLSRSWLHSDLATFHVT